MVRQTTWDKLYFPVIIDPMAQPGRTISPGQGSDRDNPGGFTHIPALDGIRGLAILLVLFDHLFWANGRTGNKIFDFISAIRDSSYVGVNLFFALSGFLITGILLDSLSIPRYFRTFYARRSLRIFPLYYGSLLLLICLSPLLRFTWSGWQYFYLTYTANLVSNFHHVPLSLWRFNINHFWSLQVEEQFYWIWPLIVYRVRSARSVVRISLIGCGIALGLRIFFVLFRHHPGFTDQYLLYSFTPACADNILFGCCLAALLRSNSRNRVLRLAPRALLASVIVLSVIAALNGSLGWTETTTAGFLIPTLGFTFVGIASTSAIALAIQPASRTSRIFESHFLRFFGTYSYGIYVFHYSLSGLIGTPLRTYVDATVHIKVLGVLASALAAGSASVVLAWLSYRYFEVPFLRLKRFFSYNEAATRIEVLQGS